MKNDKEQFEFAAPRKGLVVLSLPGAAFTISHGGCRMDGKNNGQCPFSSEGAMRLCHHFVELRRKENIAKIN